MLLVLGCRYPLEVCTQSQVNLAPTLATSGPLCEMPVRGHGHIQEKIALIDVDGLLLNSDMTGFFSQGENPVELFREKLDRAAADPCVHAVVLRINTYGGGVTATDMMWRDLHAFKNRKRIPVVACLMDVATGGGYYLATAADQIFAHPTTVTGGMGVIFNTYKLDDVMALVGIIGAPIKAGKYADLGSPIHEMDDASKKLLQHIADEFQSRFREVVEQARPEYNSRKGADFDGRIFTANQALEHKLIDRIGYLDDAVASAKQLAGIPRACVVVYHRSNDPARNLYAVTPNVPVQGALLPLSMPGLERTKLPTFLYLWQPEPTMERLSGK
jgi:protease-4